MRHAALDRTVEQRARVCRVVAVVGEGLGDRFRHHDAGGEMNDRLDRVFVHDPADEVGVADIALEERHLGRHDRTRAGGEVVDHQRPLAGAEQGQRHVAADVAGAAGHEDVAFGHALRSMLCGGRSTRGNNRI